MVVHSPVTLPVQRACIQGLHTHRSKRLLMNLMITLWRTPQALSGLGGAGAVGQMCGTAG